MDPAPTGETGVAGERYRWAFRFNVEGDLRFISHHDTLRMFTRALVRAGIPVRYSQGFNPHPRVTMPLPRPVGVASRSETVLVETETSIDPEEARANLEQHTPADIRIIGARRLAEGERLQPHNVRYCLEGDDPPPPDLPRRARELLDSAVLQVERADPRGNGRRCVDIRPYLVDLQVDGSDVEFTLRVTGRGTAKPAEIAGFLGYEPRTVNHRIIRLETQWR